MKTNPNMKLFLKGVYLYDIESCHYSIMNTLGLDTSMINKEDKTERNIQIGKMMRKNPKLTSLLRNTTQSIMDEYIRANNITERDIVIRQYDGILLYNKKLRITDLKGIPLNMRKEFIVFITSIDRRKYIALDNIGKVTIKGVPYKYDEMNTLYIKICKIMDSTDPIRIFKRLQEIKDYIMTTKNTKLFGIPTGKNKYNVFLKSYGQVEIEKTTLKIMDPTDIDRIKYFDFYITPFTKSIVTEFVR
jgi:hypothetical protein